MAKARSRSSHGGGKSKTTSDHQFIRQWAEERGGHPARVKGAGGHEDAGMIRIDFPGYSGEGSLEPISWEKFFEKFEEKQLAMVFEDVPPGDEKARFNKLVSREQAKAA